MSSKFAIQDVQRVALTLQCCRAIAKSIVKGTFGPEAAIINASLVPSIFIVHAAARLALLNRDRKALKSRSLHSEVVFNVAASKHVSNYAYF
jgi:EKC/KEOPS complex subunit CGI121/TPRKB